MQTQRSDEKCLLVLLRPRITLGLIEGPVTGPVVLGGRSYQDVGAGQFTGFYDWLRSSSGQVLGVRYWPFSEARFPGEAVAQLPYVVVGDAGRSIEIYFARDRSFAPDASDDQDWDDNTFMRSEAGDCLITFGAHWLSDADLQALRECDADWVT